ncbi:hypothetical protein AB3S75_030796 [Citrus x aurantiifolia]
MLLLIHTLLRSA